MTKNSETVPFYMTVLVKYESESDAPRVGANESVLGGKMVGVSFTDMFAEMEELQSNTRAPERGDGQETETLYAIKDGRYHSDPDRATVCCFCDTLEEAQAERAEYGDDCVIIRYDGVDGKLPNPTVMPNGKQETGRETVVRFTETEAKGYLEILHAYSLPVDGEPMTNYHELVNLGHKIFAAHNGQEPINLDCLFPAHPNTENDHE